MNPRELVFTYARARKLCEPIGRNHFTIAFFCMPEFRAYSVMFHLHTVTLFLSRLSRDCSAGTSYHIGTHPFLGQVRSRWMSTERRHADIHLTDR